MNALSYCFYPIPDAKLVPAFAGLALDLGIALALPIRGDKSHRCFENDAFAVVLDFLKTNPVASVRDAARRC